MPESVGAVVAYERVDNPIAFVETMGESCAAITNAPLVQGRALALSCLCRGLDPFEFSQKYHFIQGKPTKKAQIMLIDFVESGGKYKVVDRTPEKSRIIFTTPDGEEYDVSWTWEEAQQSRWPWKDWKNHDKGLKDNWATPTDQRNMIFVRLVSDTLGYIAPKVCYGVYTPEEIIDLDDSANGQAVQPTRSAMDAVRDNAAAASQVSTFSVETTAAESLPAAAPAEPEAVVAVPDGETLYATKSQQSRVMGLLDVIPFDDKEAKLAEALAARSVASLDQLTRSQIQELIDKLDAMRAQHAAAGN